jgi:hypothetical protein
MEPTPILGGEFNHGEPRLFCAACGQGMHASASSCPHCGAQQQALAGSGLRGTGPLPPGVAGWSWGAFLLNWIWAIGNRTWIGLLALVPYFGFIMAILLGIKGREWAWRSRPWASVEEFNRAQRLWSMWGVGIFVASLALGLAVGLIAAHFFGGSAPSSDLVNLPGLDWAATTVRLHR